MDISCLMKMIDGNESVQYIESLKFARYSLYSRMGPDLVMMLRSILDTSRC